MKNSLDVLSEKLAKILGQLDQIEGLVGKSGGSGSNSGVMGGSLANVSTTAAPASNGGFFMDFAGKAVNAAAGVVGGLSLAMPDTGMAISRRAGFYQAGVASGGMMSHGALERSVRLGLGGFSTSVGSDSAVAAMLTTRGMVPGSSTFSSTVTGVGQAARYLNMSNEVAASALEGLTSGSTSASLMRNFGVFTSNPSTGQAMGQAQIFEQLAQRFTGGRQTTLEGTMESLRRGNLGSNIRNSGLDEAQQQMLAQYMIDRSRGINMDLSDPEAISEAIKRNEEAGISNPLLSQYTQNSKDNELLERATDDYISGMEFVSEGLLKLKDAISGLPDLFYQMKGGADFFLGDKAGQGALAAGSSLINEFPILGSLVTGITANNIFNGGGNPLETFFPNEMQAFGDTGNRIGNQLGALPTMINPFEFIPAMFGAQSEAHSQASNTFANNQTTIISDFFSSIFGGGNSGGSEGSTTVPGVNAKNQSGNYGEQREGGRTHKGIDVPMPVGTPLKAVMDGVVSAAQSGSGNYSYGLYVVIEHSGGKSTLYAHMSKIMVKVGDKVTKGQIIGLSGNTGHTTGPHLHFELRVNGVHTNPASYVGLAYGPGGTKGNSSALDDNDGSVSGISGGTVVPNNFIAASWAGITGGSANVKDIILSGGSLGSLPTGSVADIPDSISGSRRSSMMGTQLSKLLRNNSPAVGGGEESLGVAGVTSSNVGSNAASRKSSKSNVTINVTIASASETEARRFAKLVKQQLEEESVLTSMGRK
jgi:murein DD-endopeptidase MepM/ murein hydrolase activator NlpD